MCATRTIFPRIKKLKIFFLSQLTVINLQFSSWKIIYFYIFFYVWSKIQFYVSCIAQHSCLISGLKSKQMFNLENPSYLPQGGRQDLQNGVAGFFFWSRYQAKKNFLGFQVFSCLKKWCSRGYTGYTPSVLPG